MNENNIKKSTLSNFLWRFAERCGAQGVTFIVSVILARLLEPSVYGTIALVTVFTSIFQVFVDSGLGNALIQKKNADNLDFSTVFYFNLLMCITIYILVFFLSPYIAKFYNNLELVPVIRVLSLTIVISGVKNIQQAYVSKNFLFKRFFYSTLGGTIFAAFIGIYMAYRGYGVWALVTQQISNTMIDTCILWITVKWRPEFKFSFYRLKTLYKYGSKLLASSLLDVTYNNVRQLIIGKMYSDADLAFYNQGQKFPKLIVNNVNVSIDSVLLPTMSRAQDDKIRVKSMTRRSIKTSVYIMAPLMMGLAFTSNHLVPVVLTEKWLPCVPYLTIFCITYMFYPIHTANLNAIKAMGRSDIFLKLEIMKKAVGITILLVTMWYGVMVMAYSLLLSSLLSQIINTWPNKKLLDYSYLEQIKDIMPSILLAVFMGVCISIVNFFNMPDVLSLLIQVPLGGIIYISGSAILKFDSFAYLLSAAKSFINKN